MNDREALVEIQMLVLEYEARGTFSAAEDVLEKVEAICSARLRAEPA